MYLVKASCTAQTAPLLSWKNEEIQLEQLHLFVQQKHLRQKQFNQVLWTLQKNETLDFFLIFFLLGLQS